LKEHPLTQRWWKVVWEGVIIGLAHLALGSACFMPWSPELWPGYGRPPAAPRRHGPPLSPAEARAWADLVDRLQPSVIFEEDQP
jgi:hypothetical protein